MSKYASLFKNKQVGAFNLNHRIALAPLTRLRTQKGADGEPGVPKDIVPTYYSQRATEGGLLISEATLIAKETGSAFANLEPGIWSQDQIEQWKKVTEAVHNKNGYIFSQLWALGRIANPEPSQTVGAKVVGPSAGQYDNHDIVEMSKDDIVRYINHYRQAALNAVQKSGFDGVEVHMANGYLIDQFIQHISNQRTDEYRAANDYKFALEVLENVVQVVGADRVGLRLSPFGTFQGMRERGEFSPLSTFKPLVEKIVNTYAHKLAYIHFIDGSTPEDLQHGDILKDVVRAKGISVISNQNKSLEDANEISERADDITAFGKTFIANPDLPQRAKHNLPLNKADPETFYTTEAEGYTTYPFYK
ncbi:hypothetical protein E3P86_01587 [Wallemia ichthyophaga]|uniref:NADH:flavin oxidoreductase/NADH oxidase N-terminal domain-containing protein n=1 Tax=Wallemia ichthyophaga TaxID=245174 RepID=A0A4T0JA61_WALIC|nr:hypothetical protein E3P86_01587 [Wallemia ichthyophaga]